MLACEEPESTVPRYVVPEPETSGARYPTNQEQAVPDTQEPVVLTTPGTSGACHSQ